MLSGVLSFQIDYLLFLSGLAGVLLAAVAWTGRRPGSAEGWGLLAAFGALGGLCDWAAMALTGLGAPGALAWPRLWLCYASFLLLAAFARRALAAGRAGRAPAWPLALAALAPLAWLVTGLEGAESAVRLGLALPGGLAAAWAMLRLAGPLGEVGRALRAGAAAMGLHAVLAAAGPLAPEGLALLQLARAACAAMLAASLWVHFSRVSPPVDQALEDSLRLRRSLMLACLAAVLAGGFLGARLAGEMGLAREAERSRGVLGGLRDNLLRGVATADRVAAALGASAALRAWPHADPGEVDQVLDHARDILPGSVVFFVDAGGMARASSNRGQPRSFVDRPFTHRAFLEEVLSRGRGVAVAVGRVSGLPGHYAGRRVDGPGGVVLGAAVVKLDFTPAALGLGGADPVYLALSQGVALASNRPGEALRPLWPAPPETLEHLEARGLSPAPGAPLLPARPRDGVPGDYLDAVRLPVAEPVGVHGLEFLLLGPLGDMWLYRLLAIAATLVVSLTLLGAFVAQERIRLDAALLRQVADRLARQNEALDEALARAEEAGRAKSLFLANMSHEIRTPLNGVLGMLAHLCETPLDAEQAQTARLAQEAGNGLLRLVGDVLDFSKVEAGRLDIVREPVATRPLLESVAAPFRPPALEKGVALVCEVSPDAPPLFWGDGGRVRQILYNLVSNALKFTRVGEVRLIARGLPGERLLLAVADTGQGIPSEKHEEVFEAFTQVDASATREHQGAGLGLAIVKGLAQAMGGSVSIESVPGRGARVSVVLPAPPCAEPERPEDRDPEASAVLPAAPPAASLEVLLVEDDRISRITAARFLAKWGHAVTLAANGREALDHLERRRFDVVLMDMQMPVLDGLSAVRLLRSDPAYAASASVPVVALTAHAMKGDRERYLAEGLDGYLAKPLEPALLRRVLEETARGPASDPAHG